MERGKFPRNLFLELIGGFKAIYLYICPWALVLGEDPGEAERANQTSMRAVSSRVSASTKGKLKQGAIDPRGKNTQMFALSS